MSYQASSSDKIKEAFFIRNTAKLINNNPGYYTLKSLYNASGAIKSMNLSGFASLIFQDYRVHYCSKGKLQCPGFSGEIDEKAPRSRLEIEFCSDLRKAGLEIIESYKVGRLTLDAALIEGDKKLAIEVDGVYWHYNSEGKRKESDIRRDQWLQNEGWLVVRVTDEEIQENRKKAINKIKRMWLRVI